MGPCQCVGVFAHGNGDLRAPRTNRDCEGITSFLRRSTDSSFLYLDSVESPS